VEVLLRAIEENPGTVWAAGRLVRFDDAGSRIVGNSSLHFDSGDIYPRMIFECLISCPSTVMVRTDTIRNGGFFDESLHSSEDYDLWLTLARDHPIAAVPVVVTNYRMHSLQNSHIQWARHYENNLRVLEKHRPRAREGFEPLFDRAVRQVHFQYGDSLYVSGDSRAARAHWRLGVPDDDPTKRRRLLGRLMKSYLPIRGLSLLRKVSSAGRSLVGG
jgi:hypothetical protein